MESEQDKLKEIARAPSPAYPPAPTSERNEDPLTDAEKQAVLDAWNSGIHDIMGIMHRIWGRMYDGRSKKGRYVKQLLAENQKDGTVKGDEPKKMSLVALTDSNREFIIAHSNKLNSMEMARTIFNDDTLGPLTAEVRVVRQFLETIAPKATALSDDDLGGYVPPRSEDQALARIAKYAHEPIVKDTMTPHQKEWVRRLICYMHTHRFVFEMANMTTPEERILFESSFVKYTYNKPDLTEEDIDLYITMCSNIVSTHRMKQELVQWSAMQDESMRTDSKIPMAIVEITGKLRTDIDAMEKRQTTMVHDLTTKRSKRMDGASQNKNSILNLLANFQEHNKRKQIIELVEARRSRVKEEKNRLANMEEFRSEILGLKGEEIFL